MRSYDDACGITRALDVVGERWALPVVRELIFGPRRYTDLAAAIPKVSTNILGSRLKELTDTGVVSKRRLPPPAAATVYELTAWGAALEPALIELGRWAAHTPIDVEAQSFSASSFALSLKTTFDPAAANVEMAVRLIMDDDVFDARINERTFSITRGPDTELTAESFDAEGPHNFLSGRIYADPKTLAAMTYQGLEQSEARVRPGVRIDAPTTLLPAFAASFSLPEPPT